MPKVTSAIATARDLAAADLARSGLTLADAKALGAEILSERQTVLLGHQALASILFRYWDPFEERFTPDGIFHRVRYVGRPAGFAGAVAKPQRYSQPAGSLNDVYVPRVVLGEPYDWKAYLLDPARPLFITEGEKKAACACKGGVPCVALGGVDVWAAAARGAHTWSPNRSRNRAAPPAWSMW